MTMMEDLRPLVDEPMERLDAEYKDWLDLREEHGKAVLAKAAIALVNNGGGYIIMGMSEDENKIPKSVSRPDGIPLATQDAVNSAVTRYAEPSFHCGLRIVPHSATGVQHPVIIVPSTLTVPVMSRRGREDDIQQNRFYIRKPGPRSEEPTTAEEWRALINRCVRANQDEMLDAIRTIVAGGVEVQNPIPDALNELRDFSTASHGRWVELVDSESDLPAKAPSRFPHGYWEIGFSLIGATPANSLAELRARMAVAEQTRFNGWPLFLQLNNNEHLAPRASNGLIEAWVGRPLQRKRFDDPQHSDFWRASLDGNLYSIRGYLEDGAASLFGTPGIVLDVTLTIRRIGEGLLFASRLAETFDGVEQIAVYCHFEGLDGRQLVMSRPSLDGPPYPLGRVCRTSDFVRETQATLQQSRDNLAEIIHPLLSPLFEQFNFYELKFATVQNVLQEMRKRQF